MLSPQFPWRRRWTRAYRRLVGSSPLAAWAGMWVAVKDGDVVASAATSADIVRSVRALGERGRGAVTQFVPPPSDVIVIGVG
jgi:hypothetical protein